MSEMPSCFRHRIRKARKDHKCCEFRGKIPAGESYHYNSGVWDGYAMDFKECNECHELRPLIPDDYDEGGAPFAGLCEYVFEGHDKEIMQKFIEIKRKRGSEIKQWMLDRLADEL